MFNSRSCQVTRFPKESMRQGGVDASVDIGMLSEEGDLEGEEVVNDAMEED